MATAMEATPLPSPAVTVEEAAQKRYEGLMAVRNKAIKGKGAWYWVHLEPVLVRSVDTGRYEAVKLRCSLCDAVFSASNPSRTATEHLKRGTCLKFTSSAAVANALSASSPKPISSIAPCSSPAATAAPHHSRKRSASSAAAPSCHVPLLAIAYPSRSSSSPTACTSSDVAHFAPPLPPPPPQRLQSCALTMLDDSVKKKKSPKSSPVPVHSKSLVDSALSLLTDWLYEAVGAGAISLSSLEHPKFCAFLRQVGLPPMSFGELTGPRLDARFEDARAQAEARIGDALFFQLATHGWRHHDTFLDGFSLVNLTVNLPNGATVFHRTVLAPSQASSKYAEEVLWDAVSKICGDGDDTIATRRCAGIVADRFRSKALRNLESQHNWMVNVPCQLQGFSTLIEDFARELPLFGKTTTNCYKLATFFNTNPRVRSIFHKYQLLELNHSSLVRLPPSLKTFDRGMVTNFALTFAMLEDVLGSVRAVKLAAADDSFKLHCSDDTTAGELLQMIQDVAFWRELDAVHSLVMIIKDMVEEMEAERPLIGQCLLLWDDLRSKVNEWCGKFRMEEEPVNKLIEKRFKKNYHPAWSAAFILDPLYLVKDPSGKYLPQYKKLTSDQEKDVDRLITRLAPGDEAHIALMELMKWRAEGMDPLYAQAVQMKELDPVTGKMRIANPQSSRIVWETCLSEFKALGKVAVRLIFLHATSSGFKFNPSLLRWVCANQQSKIALDRAQKLVFIAATSKLERKDFSSEEEKDAELFIDDVDEDVLNKPTFIEVPPSALIRNGVSLSPRCPQSTFPKPPPEKSYSGGAVGKDAETAVPPEEPASNASNSVRSCAVISVGELLLYYRVQTLTAW